MARMLHGVGVLPTAKVVEVQRSDLVGEFVGHTGPKTRRKLEEAMGGVLLVDEAYRLVPLQRGDDKDYGAEALEEIMAAMDGAQVVVIFAGYAEPMQRVFAVNEGFQRRVQRVFTFDDLMAADIARVMMLKMRQAGDEAMSTTRGEAADGDGRSCDGRDASSCASDEDDGACGSDASALRGFRLDPAITEASLAAAIERGTTAAQRRQRNGGMALPVLLDARDHLDERLAVDCCCCDELVTITMADVEAALAMIPPA
eukprot:TRINITY_DN47473_c0_g1_i1.p2 TRINITY_DN47473_c0_g1~~TRINITY_DN47473_c0_g1_i1.p2  ORF type:complete len:265 (-),score=14.79 TRINITY_DN47473_c0_g1_i1:376-1146(-)